MSGLTFWRSVQLVPLPTVEEIPPYPPYIIVGGVTASVNTAAATWNMPITQYCMNSKETTLQVQGHIPDSPRYKGKEKPVPKDLTSIVTGGPLASVNLKKDLSVSNIVVDVEHIAFLGRSQQILPAESQSPSRGKSRLYPLQACYIIHYGHISASTPQQSPARGPKFGSKRKSSPTSLTETERASKKAKTQSKENSSATTA